MPTLGIDHVKRIRLRRPVAQDLYQRARFQMRSRSIAKRLNNP